MKRLLFLIIFSFNGIVVSAQYMNDRLSLYLHFLEYKYGENRLNRIENIINDEQINPYAQINDCDGTQKLALALRDDVVNFGLRNSDFEIVDGYDNGLDAIILSSYDLNRVVMRILPGTKDSIIIFHPFVTIKANYLKTEWGYSLVDLKANMGKGRVILYKRKFADFYSPACTVMPIPGSADFWLLSGYDSVTVRAFKVSKNGVDTQYVQSRAHNQTYRQASVNSNFMGNNRSAFQYPGNIIITPRHNGSGVLISALRRSSNNGSAVIEYDFDPVKGTLSRPRTILRFQDFPDNTMQAASAIYAPNDTFVYATCESRRLTNIVSMTRYMVYQVNRFTGEKNVYLSGTKDYPEGLNAFTYLYNAPNGRIYVLKREVIGKQKITHTYDQLSHLSKINF